jgi:hypothetical protein
MEDEVKAGIEKFKAECSRQLPGIALVIPVRPTGANFLVSLTYNGQRSYITIHEDDFAEWGENSESTSSVSSFVQETLRAKSFL